MRCTSDSLAISHGMTAESEWFSHTPPQLYSRLHESFGWPLLSCVSVARTELLLCALAVKLWQSLAISKLALGFCDVIQLRSKE